MTPAYELDGRSAGREAFYAVTCDPRRHVVVEACAGAGKTWMLVARIVRALVEGARPHEILAITFTRKAAGEMRARLDEWLTSFARLTPDEAAASLRTFGMPAARAAESASTFIELQERVLETGRAVTVCTFHAWYAQLLRAAPMDLLASLGFAPGMSLVEDISDLKPALMRAFHGAVMASAERQTDFRRVSLRHGRFRLGQWLDAALERRIEIELSDEAGQLMQGVEAAGDPDAVRKVRDRALIHTAESLARKLGQRDKYKDKAETAARGLIDALAHADARVTYLALRAALFTGSGDGPPRKQLGDLPEQAALCEALDAIGAELAQQDAHDDHAAMVRLSRLLFAEYAALKRRRGLIDMVDLERVALSLLSDHALSGWVQERLDARVRHLLIDEFQDTSPLQWHALQAWLSAYAGAGGGIEAPRLFIVGDPKQSIYRFRRAEPRVFAAAQRFVVEALGGTLAACDHTWRCAPGVMTVINTVFGAMAQGGEIEGWREHTTEVARAADAPTLQRLASAERPAVVRKDTQGEERLWRPSLTVPRVEAKAALRDAEVGEVARAIDALVRSEGVAPGDILVLARTRSVLARAAEALAALHLPHVAPEELRLAELPEVQDLLAVLDVLASPGQSLSLARALKSPLFECSDEDLLYLARAARGQGWWPALMACGADTASGLQRASRLFAQWSDASATLPPHDLLDRIVHETELLRRLAAVVPPERHALAMDAVRALLVTTLELDGGRYASLYNFVRALRQRRVLAPAAQRADAVRLLTVHGAKGLEARVVFLLDTDPQPRKGETASLLVDWPVQERWPRRVAFVADEVRCPPSLQPLLGDEQAAREREEVNALYVALTRAKERLVISRTPPRHQGAAPSWWARLEPMAQPWEAIEPHTAAARAAEAFYVALPLHPRGRPSAVAVDTHDAAARLGQAVHRMLEWATRNLASDRAALARAAAAEFAPLDPAQVLAIGSRILDSVQCRPFFDAGSLAWAGNEVPLAAPDGQVRRVDRLVKLTGEPGAWWVLDYKLNVAPQDEPAYLEQLAGYRRSVEVLVPGEPVRAAFITADGALIEPS